ncbi:MAG: DUF6677 family protein [Planctomycetota bacterium]
MALSPLNAAWIGLVVPGLPQFLLGKPLRGILALVSTIGLFVLGFAMLQERLWHLQAVQGSGMLRYFPILLQPEMGNAGATIVAALLREADSPDLLRAVLLPRDGEHLAMLATGFSGIASVLWASDAFWLASGRPKLRAPPAAAAAAGWLVPGLGHVLAGQKSKGYLVGAAVLAVFALALVVSGGHGVDRPAYPFWWAAQAFCGVGVLFAALVTGPMQMDAYPELLELGIVLGAVAGLMNMMLMTDAWAVAERGDDAVVRDAGEAQA